MRTILQTEASECGLACLAMIADHYGHRTELPELRRRFSTSLKGTTLNQLVRHASALFLTARPLRLELEELPQLQCPCILHWNLNHFVVLARVDKDWRNRTTVVILDPAAGERTLSLKEVSAHFTGVAIEFAPTPEFVKKEERKKVSIRGLFGDLIGWRRAAAQIFVLSLTLELLTIGAPLFNQFIVDEVIVSGDRELLDILILSFGLLLITQTAIGLGRSWFLMRWSIEIGTQWGARVMSHLIRLPSAYFEKRHLGDIASRFGSISSIQSTLTSLFVESALDGLMAIFALGMMLAYSPKLCLVVVIAVALYAGIRWLFFAPLREASRERLVLASRENSHFLETVRSITPLKLFGRESDRLARWQNLRQDVINCDTKTQKIGILFKICNTTITGVQSLVLFYVGAKLVMDNQLTIGMLMAFTSYGGTFASRVFSLIDTFVGLRMLEMHTERLSDIVHEPAEQATVADIDTSRIEPYISLRNIHFRYAEGEPWILRGVNLDIRPGESLVFVGPSGCGKTTLCKILLGLLEPTEGQVLIGGIPIRQLGLQNYRQLIGTVMQDDGLLAGAVSDNISFFDGSYDPVAVERAARLAAIHDEISAMPMGYQTLIGDMGSSLSGGQRQRLLLARALYKKPRILVLDEATSHLDVQNERKVNQMLAELKLTRIVIAHRAESIRSAGRIIAVTHGIAREIDPSHLSEAGPASAPVRVAEATT